MKRPDFDLDKYVDYIKMIGKLATHYAWQSVLMFDAEYQQHQAAHKSAWGDQTLHLSMVIPCNRLIHTTPLRRQASGSGQRQRLMGPSSKVCLQYKRGSCPYGS